MYLPATRSVWHIRLMNMEKIRKARGWTQGELGVLAGVSQPTIARIEGGSDSVTLRTLKDIAAALKVTMAQLFDDTTEVNETVVIQAYRSLPTDRQAGWVDMARVVMEDRAEPNPETLKIVPRSSTE